MFVESKSPTFGTSGGTGNNYDESVESYSVRLEEIVNDGSKPGFQEEQVVTKTEASEKLADPLFVLFKGVPPNAPLRVVLFGNTKLGQSPSFVSGPVEAKPDLNNIIWTRHITCHEATNHFRIPPAPYSSPILEQLNQYFRSVTVVISLLNLSSALSIPNRL